MLNNWYKYKKMLVSCYLTPYCIMIIYLRRLRLKYQTPFSFAFSGFMVFHIALKFLILMTLLVPWNFADHQIYVVWLVGLIVGSLSKWPLTGDYLFCGCHKSSLVHIMACRLASTRSLPEPMLDYWQLNIRNKLQWNLKPNSYIFVQVNASEDVVCEMAAILSRPQYGYDQFGIQIILLYLSNNEHVVSKLQERSRCSLGMDKWLHPTFTVNVIAYPCWD